MLSVPSKNSGEQEAVVWYSDAMAVITIDNVSKRFGKTQALDGVTLAIKKNTIHGFLGPNGAGKTTLIRILLGIIRPTRGEASIFGLDVYKDRIPIHARLAYVPGEVNLWPNFTGGEVIDLLVGKERLDRKRIDYYLDLFELDPSKKCKTYSKGNRQKVALVAAFASPAEVFILDEPTSGLDPLMEQRFQQAVKAKHGEGNTIFLSSHILSEVQRIATAVSIIKKGRIEETLPIDEHSNLEQFFYESDGV